MLKTKSLQSSYKTEAIRTILEQIEKNRILDFYFVEIKRRYRMVLFLILSKICCLLSVRMINLSRSM